MNEIEKEYNEWKTMISQYHIPRWEELPDFDLYMDQVTSLIDRYLAPLSNQEDPLLTSAMVNNYVKFKLIDAPKKKVYKSSVGIFNCNYYFEAGIFFKRNSYWNSPSI